MSDCIFVTWAETRVDPADYCTEPAEDGSEFCAEHDPDNWQPDWDDLRKDAMYDCD